MSVCSYMDAFAHKMAQVLLILWIRVCEHIDHKCRCRRFRHLMTFFHQWFNLFCTHMSLFLPLENSSVDRDKDHIWITSISHTPFAIVHILSCRANTPFARSSIHSTDVICEIVWAVGIEQFQLGVFYFKETIFFLPLSCKCICIACMQCWAVPILLDRAHWNSNCK